MKQNGFLDSRDLSVYDGRKVEVISNESVYCEKAYSRVFKIKNDSSKWAYRYFDCDHNGWVDRDRMSVEQRNNFDALIVDFARGLVDDLGISSIDYYKTTPAIGCCLKCGFYINIGRTLQCRGCDLAYDSLGYFDREVTEYFRLSRKNRTKRGYEEYED